MYLYIIIIIIIIIITAYFKSLIFLKYILFFSGEVSGKFQKSASCMYSWTLQQQFQNNVLSQDNSL
jgi:hypothetical protein